MMRTIREQVEYLRNFVVDDKNALFDRLIQERTDYVAMIRLLLFRREPGNGFLYTAIKSWKIILNRQLNS